jgi:hypothetical protein
MSVHISIEQLDLVTRLTRVGDKTVATDLLPSFDEDRRPPDVEVQITRAVPNRGV